MNTNYFRLMVCLLVCGTAGKLSAYFFVGNLDTTVGDTYSRALYNPSTSHFITNNSYVRGFYSPSNFFGNIGSGGKFSVDITPGLRQGAIFLNDDFTMTLSQDWYCRADTADSVPFSRGIFGGALDRITLDAEGHSICMGGGVFYLHQNIELVSDCIINLEGGTLFCVANNYLPGATSLFSLFNWETGPGFMLKNRAILTIKNGTILNWFDQSIAGGSASSVRVPFIRSKTTSVVSTPTNGSSYFLTAGPGLVLDNVRVIFHPAQLANPNATGNPLFPPASPVSLVQLTDRSTTISNMSMHIQGDVVFSGVQSIIHYKPFYTTFGGDAGTPELYRNAATITLDGSLNLKFDSSYTPLASAFPEVVFDYFDQTCGIVLHDATITCSRPLVFAKGFLKVGGKSTIQSGLPANSSLRYVQLGHNNYTGSDCNLTIQPGAELVIDSMKLVNENRA